MDGNEAEPQPPLIPELARPGALTRLRSLAIDLTPIRRFREFRLLWLGESVSNIGTLGISWVAVPYQVFSITRSSLAVGLIALFGLIPVLGLGLVGGAIADAVDRRRLLLWANAAHSASAVLLAVNARPGFGHLWAIYGIVSIQAALSTVGAPRSIRRSRGSFRRGSSLRPPR